MGVNGIYGLSGSGMDIESLVKVGMMSKQNEYDKMAQKFTKNEWIKSDYLELSSQINTFNISTLSQYKQTSTMNAKSAETSATEFKATVNSTAPLMNHKVQVETMAANAYLVGTKSLTRYDTDTGEVADDSDGTSLKLANVLFKQLEVDGDTISGVIAPTNPADVDDPAALSFGKEDIRADHAYWKDSEGNEIDSSTAGDDFWDTLKNVFNKNDRYLNDFAWFGNEWYEKNAFGTYSSGIRMTPEEVFERVLNDDTLRGKVESALNALGIQYVNVGDVEEVAAEANGNVNTSDTALKFYLSDGVHDEEEFEFTYAQLLGEDDESGMTLTDFASEINKKGLNIRASYDTVHDRFSFYNTQSGEENVIEIRLENDDGYENSRSSLVTKNFFENMGLYQSVNGSLYTLDGSGKRAATTEASGNSIEFNLDGSTTVAGINSKIIVDGVSYEGKDNKVSVGGVTYTALEEMSRAATVSITQDTDAIVEKVKSFVADYNKLLGSLYEKYDEKPNSDYKPLTQSQKDSMKEEQITKWEEKAKKGMLYHDQTIGKIIQNMRSAVTNNIELDDGTSVSIFSLGISTTGLKGQLKLDEDKLKQALDKDPDIVYNVFAKLDSEHLDDAGKSGVAQRLGDVFVNATKSIKSRAGSSADISEDSDLNNLLRNLQTRMSNFKKMMTSFENALYKKYDAMESALAKLGTQLNYIMGGNS